jgi:DNA-binding NtrC family response regulator
MTDLRVLIIDDEVELRESLLRCFHVFRPQWDVRLAVTADEAFDLMPKRFDVVIADVELGGLRGTEVLRVMKSRYPKALRCVLSGMLDSQTILEAARWSDLQFCKPCPAKKLIGDIEGALKARGRLRGTYPAQRPSESGLRPAPAP